MLTALSLMRSLGYLYRWACASADGAATDGSAVNATGPENTVVDPTAALHRSISGRKASSSNLWVPRIVVSQMTMATQALEQLQVLKESMDAAI